MILNTVRQAIDPHLRENQNGFREGRTTTPSPDLGSQESGWGPASGKQSVGEFTLTPRRSRWQPAVVLADLDYLDDISLLSDNVEQAQRLLRVELECAMISLRLNAKKTEVIAYNAPPEHQPETTCMEGPQRHVWCTDLQPPPPNETRPLLPNSRVRSPLFKRMLDPGASPREVPRWMLC